ncbi:MAG: glycerophosphoryl diester phosphodiesterase [Verrucomicrobia bacterium]|nr:glycerophosphoryl diester phosphodiesterase [Verrucomicrobiota bacterium]
MTSRRFALLAFALVSFVRPGEGAEPTPLLSDPAARLSWEKTPDGWRLGAAAVRTARGDLPLGTPSGEYTLLYSVTAPVKTPVPMPWSGPGGVFPEPAYHYLTPKWADVRTPVALNTAGEARRFYPTTAERTANGAWAFTHVDDTADVRAVWSLDPAFPGDVRVTLTLTAKKAGWFSLATPTLTTVTPAELAWAVVPGCFQGAAIQPDFVLAEGYGQGLPDRPVLARERVASTLASVLTAKSGATLGVIAEPGTGADPWLTDRDTRRVWQLGLSHMNRAGQLAPTLYHPVLGEAGSQLAAGESRTFAFRYSLRAGDWVEIVRHAAYDLYKLNDFLALKRPEHSLSERLAAMHRYVTDDKTSLWRTEEFGGVTLGAQAYNGGVVGSDKDAMKNSDYGAMWMLAKLTDDPKLVRDRLPFARSFKLVQQQQEPGFFQGAAVGQYYLSKSRRFTEEWGNYVEPVALTYYSMLDLGNILLFSPQDAELRERLRLGAERLLAWQHPDGHWEVAYDRATQKPMFTELRDFRPTFYGLLVAYRILGDEKYLAAARRGADWLVRNGVDAGAFLGVCGDARFTQDFATAQIAQALLDLHGITGEARYRDAAIKTGRFYLTSIYTHPIATATPKTVGKLVRPDWQISQQGLSYEHGTSLGSANGGGPILLASHAGLFVRLHQLTGEPLFRDFARAAAWSRDAFVDPATSVASYYWNAMNRGAGPYPHHAWWQIGWITDYLISEAELRSGGAVTFPRGFFTPKVGPHASYGFAPGKVLGEPAALRWAELPTGSPSVDALLAEATDKKKIFVVLLNDSAHPATAHLRPDAATLTKGRAQTWKSLTLRDAAGGPVPLTKAADGAVDVLLAPAALAVLVTEF